MSTTKRALALAAGAVALSVAGATPATAIPPHAEQDAPLVAVFPDLDERLVGYLNVTRADWCAWEEAGAEGEPPLLRPVSPSWERVTGTGEVGSNARDELYIELWPLDADAALESSCDDTSDATEPLAIGRADVRASQMPLDGDDGRGAWLGKIGFKADLTGSDGIRYRYHGHAMELYDGKGNLRRSSFDSARLRLISFR
jgi:hypothetical protein